ncbi:hypothetical protein SERLA73DRAFT_63288 [Serpula lacrymans var. lacrymans S7.3]|uniref:Cation/H+ exchanger transmembrane domain-containing protein n=1 Tax=Serpula lacrymans var. lacrymans (strain S7.3) TaxID=936435 RepID=F8QCY6_SERL3|nr:hypothetical protein SERLA73DRAFT_63288 [Serpula lacrymans var. lacrymans S7.3]
MPEFSNNIIRIFNHYAKRATATGEVCFVSLPNSCPHLRQGGLLTGTDPSAFTSTDPLRMWIIQVGVIIIMTQLLGLLLAKMRQPKVIAEVLGGILLGPTAFGRIPGFTIHIFPSESLPYLSLVANIGLCLFLFLVGLEIDAAIIKRNARLSTIVSLAGMALPFGLGSALSLPLYHHFIDPSIQFTHFMLFTGVAYSITAFPVLCRILTELKLLDTTVGIIVLSAGVGNDVVGWTLLALAVALVNAGSGLTAVWVLLCCVAWTLFLLWPVKWALYWIARKTGSIENGPTMFFMTVVIITLFSSAFFTDIIGVNAIFGAFLAGIIVPREGGLTIALTEKLEDMVSIIFLPLYFTISGLNTNLGLLNNGITWGFTIAICSLAFTGKFGGCMLAARFSGFSWREASAVGALMSCKGLVELIVLNVGLSAGILSQRVFSMFVLEAVLLTFMTTPLVNTLYPPERRTRVSPLGEEWEGEGEGKGEGWEGEDGLGRWKTRFTIVLDKLEHMPGMMAFTQLIQPPHPSSSSSPLDATPRTPAFSPPIHIDALRLLELSDRTSAVMRSSAADTLLYTDPLLGIFGMYGELNGVGVRGGLEFVGWEGMAGCVTEWAVGRGSEMVCLPWLPPMSSSPTGAITAGEDTPAFTPRASVMHNPFEAFFGGGRGGDKSASAIHSQFVRGVFAQAKTDVAIFVDPGHSTSHLHPTPRGRGLGGMEGKGRGKQHVFFPFFGGPDDRLALEFVVQLCASGRMSASVVRVCKRVAVGHVEEPKTAYGGEEREKVDMATTIGFPDTVYGAATTATRLQSETADNVVWERYAARAARVVEGGEGEAASTLTAALSRMTFSELSTPAPIHAILHHGAGIRPVESGTRLLVVAGRSRRMSVESHVSELREVAEEFEAEGEMVRKTIGDVGAAVVLAGVEMAGMVVVQAVNVGLE